MTTTTLRRRRVGLRTSSATDLLLLFMCLSYLLLIIADEIYSPSDVYSISCGSSSNFTFDGRNWTSDINTKLLLEPQNKSTSSSSVAVNVLIPTTILEPYFLSARLSYSQFTYSFPVTSPGQKYIRLFFNPTSYQNFDPTRAYFSVKSGDYTLLKDFNASLYADADDDPASDTFFREYSVYVQDGDHTLNVTFIPSKPINTTTHYAFINGIEVVSMPPFLYHTNPNDDNTALQLVGSTATIQYNLENKSALETKYRFNVGGRIISPSGDTGMLRSWEADDDYKTSPGEPASEFAEITKLNFSMIPNYTAPDQVYRTLRHMGRNTTVNWSFNLTWELPVDSGFTYMLRLHFCELDPVIQKPGDRVFYIYIQDQVADDYADVLMWTYGHKGVPIVKDYAVIVPSDNQKDANISLKMHPRSHSVYVDAVLNGLELFKINRSDGNLAGPNPNPRPKAPSSANPEVPSSNHTTTAAVAGAVSGAVLLLVIVVSVFFLVKRWRRKSREGGYYKSSKHNLLQGSSQLPTNLCRHFSIEEIRTATNNFDELLVIGAGGFGNVYKGYIDDGSTPVAIKRLKPGSQQGANEFLNEIEMLSQLRHLHLVSLIGYCCERNEMILVYDFMTRGTLRDHLYSTTDNNKNPSSLSWKQRLEICIGAARGLHYLHTGAKYMIIHRDVKSTNILLDERWVAKVSDFGLSRFGPTGTAATHVSTVVKGSVGYLDPEYYKRQRLTEKSDVYSFGVVLLEVLCGRASLLRNVEKEQVSLVDWARRCYDVGSLDKIVDPTLKGEIAIECLKKFGDLAMSCLHDDGTQRPSMNDVVGVLEFVLQLQQNSSIEGGDSEVLISSSISDGGLAWDDNSKSSGVSMTTSTTTTTSTENVFSEIGDPKGR